MNREEMLKIADKIIELLKKEKVTNNEADTIAEMLKTKIQESIEYDKKMFMRTGFLMEALRKHERPLGLLARC